LENRYLSWNDVCHIVDHMVSQATGHFDAVVAISRGGIVPAGLLSKRLDIRQVFVASVRFFREDGLTVEWPVYLEFPEDRLIQGKRILLVADRWEQGLAVTSVRERIEMAGGEVVTAVLHYCPTSAAAFDQSPDIFGEQTEDTIVYPWQAERGRLPHPS
jgi:hypoxanthine phosphoribosyltransferase